MHFLKIREILNFFQDSERTESIGGLDDWGDDVVGLA